MTVEQAIESVKQVGSLEVVGGAIYYKIRRRSPETEEALATLKAAKPTALALLTRLPPQSETAPLESVLKGNAIELWADSSGERFWLVADEADAVLLGQRRGIVYTAAEARRVIEVADPAIVAEIHRWKRNFDATVSEFRRDN